MPIDTPRKEYTAAATTWQKCRDAYEGARAVKARGTAYLPALSTSDATLLAPILDPNTGAPFLAQSSGGDTYAGYLMRAPYYNATKRTVQGLTGTVFRKEPNVEGVPAAYEDQLSDLTLTRQSFTQVSADIFDEQVLVGRVAVLLDMPVDSNPLDRPYWVFYLAEQITWWRTERRGGDQLLTGVVLKETVEEPDAADPFLLKEVTQYRYLQLLEGRCEVTVYRQTEQNKEWFAFSQAVLMRRGAALTFIPFLIFGAHYIGPEVDEAPLIDLVEENLSHYRSSADLEHGLHWTALPTPWIACQNANSVMTIGSSQAWNLGPDGKAGMLEFTGTGLGALADRIKEKEHHMAVLGAKLLEDQPSQAETATVVMLRHSGEGSVLRRMASVLGQGLQTVLRWHLWWAGMDETAVLKVMVGVNQEFMEERLSADELKALVLAWQSDAISWNTLFFNAQRGGVVPPGVTDEQEQGLILAAVNQKLITNGIPAPTGGAQNPPDPNAEDAAA